MIKNKKIYNNNNRKKKGNKISMCWRQAKIGGKNLIKSYPKDKPKK